MTSSDKPRSLLLSLWNVYETLAISAPTVVDAARRRVRRDVCDARLASWARRVMHHVDMHVTVHGEANLSSSSRDTFIAMSNHQSHYDVAVLYHVLGSNLRMVGKKELFRVPIFGHAMRDAGFIEVDRSDTRRAIASLEEAKRHLANGTRIWIAPEGTRSKTGELLPFKKGGFVLALDVGAAVLPLTIRGTLDVLPPGSIRTRPGVAVDVTVHPPVAADPAIATAEPKRARDALMADVRRAIASAL